MKNMNYKSFAVIGCGRYGYSLAETLSKFGYDVLVIDVDEEAVQNISQVVTKAVVANSTDEKVLRDLGLNNMDAVFVAIGGNIEASIMTTLMVKEIGAKNVICKANNENHAKALEKIGADKIVFPEKDMGRKTANAFISPNFMEMMSFEDEYSVAEIKVPDLWVGKSLLSLNLREKYKVNIVGIRKAKEISIIVDPNRLFEKDDILFVIGKTENITKIGSM